MNADLAAKLSEIRRKHAEKKLNGVPSWCNSCRDNNANALDWPCDVAKVFVVLDDLIPRVEKACGELASAAAHDLDFNEARHPTWWRAVKAVRVALKLIYGKPGE